MPQIREYRLRSEVSAAITPGVDAERISIGRGISALGEGIGNLGDALQKRDERKDISARDTELAKFQAEESIRLRKESDAGTLDAENFLRTQQENLQKLKGNAETGAGRAFFDAQASRMGAHFIQSTTFEQMDVAKRNAINENAQAFAARSTTVYSDPTAFEVTKQQHLDALDAKAKALPADVLAKLKAESSQGLATQAIRGTTDLNPEFSKRQILSGKWDKEIDGDTKNRALAEADAAINAKRVQADITRANIERLRKEKADDSKLTILTDITNGNFNNITERILKDPYMTPESKEHYLNQMDQGTKRAHATNPATFNNLFHKISKGEIRDPDQLDQFMGNGLSFEDLGKLRSEVSGKKTPEGQREDALTKQMMRIATNELRITDFNIADPQGERNIYAFQRYMIDTIAETKKRGEPVEELFNEKSPNFIGKDMKARFGRSVDDVVRDMSTTTQFARTPEEERRPGETISDYAKRKIEMKKQKNKTDNTVNVAPAGVSTPAATQAPQQVLPANTLATPPANAGAGA